MSHPDHNHHAPHGRVPELPAVPDADGDAVPDDGSMSLRSDVQVAWEQRLEARRHRARALWRDTVPPRFEDAPETGLVRPVALWLRDQIERAYRHPLGLVTRGPSLLLIGGTGTGKTHAAWSCIGHLAKRGVLESWQVITSTKLYAALRPRAGVETEAVLERYIEAPLLVWDDVARSRQVTPAMLDIDYRLVNERYEQDRPTIVTTNLAPKPYSGMPKDEPTLRDRMEDRTFSRLSAMFGANIVSLGLGDRRRGEGPDDPPGGQEVHPQ